MKSESAVLKRLGPVPFWRGERKCLDVLGEIYSRAMDSAQNRLAKNDIPKTKNTLSTPHPTKCQPALFPPRSTTALS